MSIILSFPSCHHSTEPSVSKPADTTSHNFTWTIQALGDGNGSTLKGIAIINDTLAYAVGAIYLQDSSGNWNSDAYNVVRWNGTEWKLMRLHIPGEAVDYPPLTVIWAFSADTILVSPGGMIATFNGTTATSDWRMNSLLAGEILRIFPLSAQEMYLVGVNGTIAYLSNNAWQSLSSGTWLPIQDIWGAKNPTTGETEVYAVASNNASLPSGKKLIRLSGSTVTAMSDSGLNDFLNGIWFPPGGPYTIVGGGYFHASSVNQNTIWQGGVNVVTTYYTEAIRGNAANDFFLVGDWGDLVHYNGSTWKSFQSQGVVAGNFWAVAMNKDLVIAVGGDGVYAYVAVGRR